MDSSTVQAFLAVARTRGLASAANQLHLSQSAVSRRLQTLEREVGVRLVERRPGHRDAHLTAEGERFLDFAEGWERLLSEIGALPAARKVLSVGAPDSVCTYVLPSVLGSLAEERANLRLRLRVENNERLYEDLQTRNIDLAISSFDRVPSDLTVEPLLQEEFMVVMSPTFDSFTANADGAVSVENLPPETEVFLDWGSAYMAWHRAAWPPRVFAVELDSTHLIPVFLEAHNRWAVVPSSIAAALRRDGFSAAPIYPPPPSRQLSVAWLKRSPSTQMSEEAAQILQSLTQEAAHTWRHDAIHG